MGRVGKLSVAALAVVGLGAAGMAWAQEAPAGGPAMPHRGGPGCMVQSGRLSEMLTKAHWDLRITPQEDAAWTKMTQDVTAALQPLAAQCGQRPAPATTLPDRLARMVQMGQMRQQVLSGVQAAVTTMYNDLAPDQKAAADRMFRRHGHHGPGPGGMMPPQPPR